jgi:hypothetical protein
MENTLLNGCFIVYYTSIILEKLQKLDCRFC